MNMAIRWLNNGQITYMTDFAGRHERVYLVNQKAPSTPEGRIAAHVELMAAIHLSEMRKEEPIEMNNEYQCENCGSRSISVRIGQYSCERKITEAAQDESRQLQLLKLAATAPREIPSSVVQDWLNQFNRAYPKPFCTNEKIFERNSFTGSMWDEIHSEENKPYRQWIAKRQEFIDQCRSDWPVTWALMIEKKLKENK